LQLFTPFAQLAIEIQFNIISKRLFFVKKNFLSFQKLSSSDNDWQLEKFYAFLRKKGMTISRHPSSLFT